MHRERVTFVDREQTQPRPRALRKPLRTVQFMDGKTGGRSLTATVLSGAFTRGGHKAGAPAAGWVTSAIITVEPQEKQAGRDS